MQGRHEVSASEPCESYSPFKIIIFQFLHSNLLVEYDNCLEVITYKITLWMISTMQASEMFSVLSLSLTFINVKMHPML